MYATTSTVVVGHAGGCLLVDPALTAGELEGLRLALEARGLRPVARWVTHPHWDHLVASAGWPDVPTFAAADGRAWLAAAADDLRADAVLAAWLTTHPGDAPAVVSRPPAAFPVARAVEGLPRLDWPGPTTLVVATDGHAPAHGSLVLPDGRTLLAGDVLSDTEIPLLDLDRPDPVGRYRAALDALEDAVVRWGVRTLVPGHGAVARSRDEIAARLATDRAYLDAVGSGRPSGDARLAVPWQAETDRRQRAIAG